MIREYMSRSTASATEKELQGLHFDRLVDWLERPEHSDFVRSASIVPDDFVVAHFPQPLWPVR